MRVLIATSPGVGHILPTVSTAWALRAAGHDVILATGGHSDLAAHAGLHVVDTAPGVDFGQVFRNFVVDTPGQAPGPGTDQLDLLDFVGRMFATVSGYSSDRTVELARRWRPDIVLFSPLQGVGLLAAQVVDVPAVAHTIGVAQPAALWSGVTKYLAEDYERFGVLPTEPAAVLDVSPPSLRAPDSEGWSMRYVPYNGGAILPPWLLEPRERPLVTVTLGSVLPLMAGVGALLPFVAAAGAVDVDFVVTLGGARPADFGAVPDNVRLVEWVPLGPLLAVSDAVIHHGGSGTTLTALDAGLPQLVLPQGADQFLNAAGLAKVGAGAVVRPEELDADRIAELLADTSMRAVAEGIAAEMAAQPTPADLVPRVIALAS
jgi:UDP:flavonoid glycosyltransferase YjiC (YdhE family)